MEKALTHADNVYRIPNTTIEGRVCYTNLPPNTAFRGFGAPQGVMTMEQRPDNSVHRREIEHESMEAVVL